MLTEVAIVSPVVLRKRAYCYQRFEKATTGHTNSRHFQLLLFQKY